MTEEKETGLSPLARLIADDLGHATGQQAVIGLSGPQGAGKTTLIRQLEAAFGERLLALSLDDFYLPKRDRERLAAEISPLFDTRGPPGTHDIDLLMSVLDAVTSPPITLPRFDKKTDDRLPRNGWRTVTARPDIVLLEGWLIGATVPPDFTTGAPLNSTERSKGAAAWRAYQAGQLSGPYAALFDRIDRFIHLTAPDFDTVIDWRLEQEATSWGVSKTELPEHRRSFVRRFVQHYERLTRAMAQGHRRKGQVIELSADRRPAR